MPSKKHSLAPGADTSSSTSSLPLHYDRETSASARADTQPPGVVPLQQPQILEAAATPPSAGRKKPTSGSSRTGQACDRCKTRKIRCDNTEGGCLPCRQNNTECKTTDRVTQRATKRGHTESLERDNSLLKQQLYIYEQQLREAGVEPKPIAKYLRSREPFGQKWQQQEAPEQTWSQSDGQGDRDVSRFQSVPERREPQRNDSNMYEALPTFRTGLVGDNYLGVSSSRSIEISPIRGTSLSLFGVTLDLTEFVSPSLDDPESPMSYQTVLSAFMRQRSQSVEDSMKLLPSTYEECSKYTEWFLMGLNAWFPVIHKDSFRALIVRVYQGITPTPAETATLQISLANIKYQMASRNPDGGNDNGMFDESFAHYQSALAFIPELVSGRTVADMQALALICHYVRGFPRSGAAWMMSSWILNIAVELGYHRSSTAWKNDGITMDALEDDLRKRIFWALLMINVAISGKLGRPMPLRPADFDVELPEPVDDNDQPEPGAPKVVTCSFRGTLEFFKLTEIWLEVYNCIYAIRHTTDYEESVRRIEGRLERWRKQLPVEYTESAIFEKDLRIKVFALWIEYWECESQLILHHPALSRSTSSDFVHRNLIIATTAASKLIHVVGQLAAIRCLDTTWYNTSVYIAAVFTLLFSAFQRRDHITTEEFSRLQSDMNICLDVLLEVGVVLGTGPKLRDSVRLVVEKTLGEINRSRVQQTASAAVARSHVSQAPEIQPLKAEDQHSNHLQASGAVDSDQDRTSSHAYRPNVYQFQPSQSTQQSQNSYGQAYMPQSAQTNSYPYHTYGAARDGYQMSNQQLQPAEQYATNVNQAGNYDSIRAWQDFMEASSRDAINPEGYLNNAGHALMSISGRSEQGDAASTNPYLGQMTASGFQSIVAQNMMGPDDPHWPINVYQLDQTE